MIHLNTKAMQDERGSVFDPLRTFVTGLGSQDGRLQGGGGNDDGGRDLGLRSIGPRLAGQDRRSGLCRGKGACGRMPSPPSFTYPVLRVPGGSRQPAWLLHSCAARLVQGSNLRQHADWLVCCPETHRRGVRVGRGRMEARSPDQPRPIRSVVPHKGHRRLLPRRRCSWVPACAGMTMRDGRCPARSTSCRSRRNNRGPGGHSRGRTRVPRRRGSSGRPSACRGRGRRHSRPARARR